MSQILKKPYDCRGCRKQIRIAKIDNPGPDAKEKQWKKGLQHMMMKQKKDDKDFFRTLAA